MIDLVAVWSIKKQKVMPVNIDSIKLIFCDVSIFVLESLTSGSCKLKSGPDISSVTFLFFNQGLVIEPR